VLVVGRVLLALVGAGAAGHSARLDRRAEDAEIGLGLPDEGSGGGIAGIGAVEAEANAADQLLYVRLAEVGVGAARARSRAVDALVDTAQKQVAALVAEGPNELYVALHDGGIKRSSDGGANWVVRSTP
jgi:hypothetical protein